MSRSGRNRRYWKKVMNLNADKIMKRLFLTVLFSLYAAITFAQDPGCPLGKLIGDVKVDKVLSDALVENPALVDAWRRLNDAEVDLAFRKNPAILEKVNDLYHPDNFQLPGNRPIVNGKKVDGNFTVKTRDGKHDIYFDKNGFPNFDEYSLGNNFSYKPDGKVLTGGTSDLTSATSWLKAKYAKDPNVKITSNGTNIDVTIDGKTNTYTWHHYQDGKTLIPVLTSVHTNISHTGGAAIIQRGLEGMFSSVF